MYSSGPCSKDGAPKRKLSKKSNSSLKGSSFEVPAEVGTQLGNNVHLKDDDENYEEPSIVSSKPGWSSSNGHDWAEAKAYPSQEETAKPKSKILSIPFFISFEVNPLGPRIDKTR